MKKNQTKKIKANKPSKKNHSIAGAVRTKKQSEVDNSAPAPHPLSQVDRAAYYRNYCFATPFLVGLLQGLDNAYRAKAEGAKPSKTRAKGGSWDASAPSIFGPTIDDALAKQGEALWNQLSKVIRGARVVQKQVSLETMRDQFPAWRQSSAELIASLPDDQKKSIEKKNPVETLRSIYHNTEILCKTLTSFGIYSYKNYKIIRDIPIEVSAQAGIVIGEQLGYWLGDRQFSPQDTASWTKERARWENMAILVDLVMVSQELTKTLPISVSVLCLQHFCMALAGHQNTMPVKKAPERVANSIKPKTTVRSGIPEWLAISSGFNEKGFFQGINFPLVETFATTVASTARSAGTALREQWKGKPSSTPEKVTSIHAIDQTLLPSSMVPSS